MKSINCIGADFGASNGRILLAGLTELFWSFVRFTGSKTILCGLVKVFIGIFFTF